jgi:hypothetical protein
VGVARRSVVASGAAAAAMAAFLTKERRVRRVEAAVFSINREDWEILGIGRI